jgi:hypothetical protein
MRASKGGFMFEQILWQVGGLWPFAARRRLWLSAPVAYTTNPEHYLTISTIIRNEGPYLSEWLEFHSLLGVTHFFIYDNGSTDNTLDVLEPYQQAGIVSVVNWANCLSGWEGVAGPKGRMQKLSMLHSIANYGHKTHWMAFIDADEFLYPLGSNSLPELMEGYNDLESLSVYWNMFGTSGHTWKPKGLVTENFTKRLKLPDGKHKHLSRVKSIVKPSAVLGVHNSHTFILKNGYPQSWNERHQPIGHFDHRLDTFSNDVVRINHYYSKSLSEYRARQKVPTNGTRQDFRRNDRLLNLIEADPIEDLSIQRFIPELKRRISANAVDDCNLSYKLRPE